MWPKGHEFDMFGLGAQRRTRNSQYCHLRHYYSTESTSKYDQKETAAPPPSSSNGIARVQGCGGPGGVTDQPAVIPCGLSGSLVPGYHWDWQLDKKVSINLLLHLRYGHSGKGASGWIPDPSLHHSPWKIRSVHLRNGKGRIYIPLCPLSFPVLSQSFGQKHLLPSQCDIDTESCFPAAGGLCTPGDIWQDLEMFSMSQL